MRLFGTVVWGILAAVALSLASPVQAGLTYSGELSVDDGGLIAGGKYGSGTTLSWTVTNETESGLWRYTYTLEVSGTKAPAISHMIVEVSDGDPGPAFTQANLFSPTTNPTGWIGNIQIQTYTSQQGNPGMPGSLYGVKFNAAGDLDARTVTLTFESDRIPVWGDFYAKGGSNSMVINQGFSADDPTDPAGNGSYLNHVLVPDTMTMTIPSPGAVLLVSFGTGLVSWLRRRRMM